LRAATSIPYVWKTSDLHPSPSRIVPVQALAFELTAKVNFALCLLFHLGHDPVEHRSDAVVRLTVVCWASGPMWMFKRSLILGSLLYEQ